MNLSQINKHVYASSAQQTPLQKLPYVVVASDDWSTVANAGADLARIALNQQVPISTDVLFSCFFESSQVSATVLYRVDDAGAVTYAYLDVLGNAHAFYDGVLVTNVYPQKGDIVRFNLTFLALDSVQPPV